MASELPKCPVCKAKCRRVVHADGFGVFALCTREACGYEASWDCHPTVCALIAKLRKAPPRGKVLARGHIGKRHAKNMLCRRPKGAKCKGCIDRESCRPVEVREVGKGGGE